MAEKAPTSAQELIDRILAKCSEGDFIFRGTTQAHSGADDGKGVQSSLYKKFIKEDGAINEHHLLPHIEQYIIGNAKKHFPDSTSNIEILTDLRHYEGKVNLIDFTRSLYVALFFACHGDPQEEDGEVIMWNIEKLISRKDIDYGKLKSPSLFIIDPSKTRASQPRVIAQHSVFVYSTEGYINKSRYISEKIPHSLKDAMLQHIRKFHSIDQDSIYNDLFGFIQNEDNFESAASYFYRGNAKHQSGDLQKAIEYYNKVTTFNPQFVNSFYNRGVTKQKSGDFQGAIADYSKAIEINPQDAEVYRNRALAKQELGDLQGTIADYDQAIKINPQLADACNNRGVAKGQLGDLQGAIADYSKAIAINPQYAEAYNNRGIAKQRLKQLKEAIVDYNKAIGINPQYAEAYNNRALAKQKLKDSQGAIADYSKAIGINPQYVNAYNNRGNLNQELGQFKEAIADYDEAIKINPQDAEVYKNRGAAKHKSGDLQGAIADFVKYQELTSQAK